MLVFFTNTLNNKPLDMWMALNDISKSSNINISEYFSPHINIMNCRLTFDSLSIFWQRRAKFTVSEVVGLPLIISIIFATSCLPVVLRLGREDCLSAAKALTLSHEDSSSVKPGVFCNTFSPLHQLRFEFQIMMSYILLYYFYKY